MKKPRALRAGSDGALPEVRRKSSRSPARSATR
jgi:hypothetical protein